MSKLLGAVNFLKKSSVLIALGVVAVSASGCASVKIANPMQAQEQENAQVGARERVALLRATQQLKNTPWPNIQEASITSRMTNVMFGSRAKSKGLTRNDSLDIYASALSQKPAPEAALMSDANRTLRQARQVAEAGRLAAVAIKPSSDDIAVLENAISEVRDSREMYLAAMKLLKKDGHPITKADQMELKEAFTQTIRDIGQTADRVANRVADRRSINQFAAQPINAAAN